MSEIAGAASAPFGSAGVVPTGPPCTAVATGRPRVLLIGGKLKHVRKARELGLDRLLPFARALRAAYPFQAAMSLFEPGLLPTARVNEALGLGGEFVDDHGFPVIVKPSRESGSLGVFLVRDRADVDVVAQRFRSLDGQWADRDLSFADSFEEFLMEEFLDGPEISVETLSFKGRHVVVAVTDMECVDPGFVEIGHSQPSGISAETLRDVTQVVTDFLDAVGLRNGPGHTEIKLTSRGPRIVESHNRIGGDRINELAEIAYGVDMECHALGARFGVVEPLPASPEPRVGAAVGFLTPEPGRVVEVTGVEAVRADPAFVDLQLDVEPGDDVSPLTWNEDKVGHVITRGATAAEGIAHGRRLSSAIHVRTEPVA